MEKDRIIVYDTTLRDGIQGIGVNFTLEDKLQITRQLDEIGVDYIEGGFPLANEKESLFFERIKQEKLKHAKVVAFGSTRKPGMKADSDAHLRALLNAETAAVLIVGKTWKAHIEQVLKTSPAENLDMIYDSISYLKQKGKRVFFDLEHFFDGYKDDPDYALQVLQTGNAAGGDCLVLCDTNGGVLPGEVEKIFKNLPREQLSSLGVHFHNDCGTAVANTLAAVELGATHVNGGVPQSTMPRTTSFISS